VQLALAERAARVGSIAYDVDSDKLQISAGYAALHGFPSGTREITRSEWKVGVHQDDLARVEELRNRAFRSRSNEYGVDYRIVWPGGEIRWIDARMFVSYRSDGRPQRVVGVNIDITGRKRAEQQQSTLHAELDHRVKNVLATVSAIAAHTKDASNSMNDFVTALDSRIRSMASTHELLSSSRWEGVHLRELVRRELAPYASNNNACIEGSEVILRAEAAQAVASAVHELATNAAKYGALAKRGGRVSVRLHSASNGQAPGPLARISTPPYSTNNFIRPHLYSMKRSGNPSHQGTGVDVLKSSESRTTGRCARRWKRTVTSRWVTTTSADISTRSRKI
jgi:PAS domain S-box-containing protein